MSSNPRGQAMLLYSSLSPHYHKAPTKNGKAYSALLLPPNLKTYNVCEIQNPQG